MATILSNYFNAFGSLTESEINSPSTTVFCWNKGKLGLFLCRKPILLPIAGRCSKPHESYMTVSHHVRAGYIHHLSATRSERKKSTDKTWHLVKQNISSSSFFVSDGRVKGHWVSIVELKDCCNSQFQPGGICYTSAYTYTLNHPCIGETWCFSPKRQAVCLCIVVEYITMTVD